MEQVTGLTPQIGPRAFLTRVLSRRSTTVVLHKLRWAERQQARSNWGLQPEMQELCPHLAPEVSRTRARCMSESRVREPLVLQRAPASRVASSLWVKARVLVEPRRSLALAQRGRTWSFALLVRTERERSASPMVVPLL